MLPEQFSQTLMHPQRILPCCCRLLVQLKAVSASVNVGLLKDVGTTGRFDVWVRAMAGPTGLQLVHSKKGGHGFVDSVG